jgi:hypothetical protein
MYDLSPDAAPLELRSALQQLTTAFPQHFGLRGRPVRFVRLPEGGYRYRVVADLTVHYGEPVAAWRALGALVAGSGPVEENSSFDMLGAMVDCSRNGVPRVETLCDLLRHLALFGFNTLLLYMEDTYQVPGRPFFGYLRGAYSHDELAAIDRYAEQFGMSVIPCIQTLGHLEQILQWPAYADVVDQPNLILADHEPTYELLGEMLHAASAPFRSRRINLGMDEAHGLGFGKHYERFGPQQPFDIMFRHLERLRAQCRTLGLQPMMWSDMFFRLVSGGDYYNQTARIPQSVIDRVPHDVQLCYWDYYHTDAAFYEEHIERHRALGTEPLMAGGVWTWNHFWAALPYSLNTTDACLTACKHKGLRQAFATLWGDDGMECDLFSALPGLAFFAEHGWRPTIDDRRLHARFEAICGGRWSDWIAGSDLDTPPPLLDGRTCRLNLSKGLLWEDPLLPLASPQLDGYSLRSFYDELAGRLRGSGVERLVFPAQIASVLALKDGLRQRLAGGAAVGELRPLRQALARLAEQHRKLWLSLYKPFGLEVIDGRYGAALARIDSIAERLEAGEHLAELDVPLRKAWNVPLAEVPTWDHARLATPSCIK